eukprot:tig00000681_g3147.t1
MATTRRTSAATKRFAALAHGPISHAAPRVHRSVRITATRLFVFFAVDVLLFFVAAFLAVAVDVFLFFVAAFLAVVFFRGLAGAGSSNGSSGGGSGSGRAGGRPIIGGGPAAATTGRGILTGRAACAAGAAGAAIGAGGRGDGPPPSHRESFASSKDMGRAP